MAAGGVPPELLDGYPEMLAEVSETGRRLRRDERDSRRELGEHAAESGYTLRELVDGYLGATRRAWPGLPGVTAARGAGDLRRVGESVLAAVEGAVAALSEGHERARRIAVRKEEAARREFVDDLLHGRSDPGRLAERAERFGLAPAAAYAVAVACGPQAYDAMHPLTRRVERELFGRFGERDVLVTTKDGRLVCVAPAADSAVLDAFTKLAAEERADDRPDGHRIALGRPHSGMPGVARGYDEALQALDIGARLGLPSRVLNSADLLVFPVLLRDRAAMADLVRSVLGPLTQARGGPVPLLETLAAYAAARYVGAEAARRLDLSVRALSYRLDRIKALTGFDPDDAVQRYTLETAAMGARLLGWPERTL